MKILNKVAIKLFRQILKHLDAYRLGIKLDKPNIEHRMYISSIREYTKTYVVYFSDIELIMCIDKKSWEKAINENTK